MPLFLDTCALLWLAQDRSQLSSAAFAALTAATEPPVVSAISAFEVAIKWRKGKLALPLEAGQWFIEVLRQYGLVAEPVTAPDAILAAMLPPHHNDPADRIIVATAVRLGATILTPDHLIHVYLEAKSLW